jgi:hypothetical protein
VAEIGLDRAPVLAIVGKLVAAGVPQHMRMNQERNARKSAGASNYSVNSRPGQRCCVAERPWIFRISMQRQTRDRRLALPIDSSARRTPARPAPQPPGDWASVSSPRSFVAWTPAVLANAARQHHP